MTSVFGVARPVFFHLLVTGFVVLAGMLSPATAAAGEAGRDSVVIGMVLEPPHLDPTAGAAAAIGEVVYANVFEGLTRIDERGEVVPGLAEGWDISPDGLTYTFHLRDRVRFHNGYALTADMVRQNLDALSAPSGVNPQKRLFEDIESVAVAGERTVVVKLSRLSGRFLFNLGLPAALILSRHENVDNKTRPVGTGPFVFSRWYRGDRLELVRNPDYWGEPAALSRVTFRFISDPTAALAGMLSGDIDGFPNFPAPESLVRFQMEPGLRVTVGATQGKTILALNNARKPLNDIRVRRAIAHAVDRAVVIRDVENGAAVPIGSHMVPMEPGYVDLTGFYPHDVEKAKALLKEAGVEHPRIEIAMPPPAYARRGGEVLAYQLEKAGISVVLRQMEWAEWLSGVFHGKDFDATVIAHVEPFDLDIYARPDYYFGYDSAVYQLIYQRLATEMNGERRRELVAEAQRIIAEDCVNVFLFLLPKIGVWNAKLEGYWTNVPVPANDMTGVRWTVDADGRGWWQ
ncbi:MAG: ABC transporter substrate-binding protein [Methylobacteriaceae bacterium]|jgi:peptide/nickel transport system substrate-binding protein|nr:ABC transporter substrate-binding protein [Methylobacteriaceae bacterium]